MEQIKNFFKDESGASAVEYGLLVALIAVGLIAAMGTLKTAIQGTFEKASDSMGS
jgi:pilus assembly protein Flp/PilA